MHSHKIIEIFRSFDKRTIRRLQSFLRSPYSNNSQKIARLGEYLLSFYPNFNSKDLTEEKAFETLELGKPFTRHEIIRYVSKLLATVEDFIIAETLNDYPFHRGFLLASYYYQSKNEAGLKKINKQNHKQLSTAKMADSSNYFYTYLNRKLVYNFTVQKNNIGQANEHLHKAVFSLDTYYLIELLQASISFIHHNKRKPDSTDFPLLESTLVYLEQHSDGLAPLVKLWYLAFKLTEKIDNSEHYTALKQALLRYQSIIPKVDVHNFTVILNNALRNQLHKGRQWYLEERFETYQIEIQEGWLIANGIISYNVINNIIIVALALGKIGYASSFLEKHKDYLIEEVRDNIVAYNQARITFARGEYGKSLHQVQQINYFNHSTTLGIKRLQIMCFWELKDFEQVNNALNALKIYLYRLESYPEHLKELNMHFTKVVGLLAKHADQALTPETVQVIKEILSANPLTPEIEWMMGKISG